MTQPVSDFERITKRMYEAGEIGRGTALALGILAPTSPFDVPTSLDCTQALRLSGRLNSV